MKPPAELNLPEGAVLHLKKALYGLKQAPRSWNIMLVKWLKTQGFRQCISDPCLFVLKFGDEIRMLILIYVDDILFAATSEEMISDVIQRISLNHFQSSAEVLTSFWD